MKALPAEVADDCIHFGALKCVGLLSWAMPTQPSQNYNRCFPRWEPPRPSSAPEASTPAVRPGLACGQWGSTTEWLATKLCMALAP
jgi:hypothetical protein